MKIPLPSFLLRVKEFFLSGNILVFWYHHYKIPVFIGFLVILSIGGWNYYYSVYRYRFTDEEKQQYIDSYFKETTFKEEKFQQVVDSLTGRARIHNEPIALNRNIFLGK
jgi:hypothetical protein